MTATPALNRSMVILPVIPRPAAAFSPLTTTKSTPHACFNFGTISITAFRPGSPITSPRNKSRSIAHTQISLSYISSRRSRIKFAMCQVVALSCFGLLSFNDFHFVPVLVVVLAEIFGGESLAAPWALPAKPLQARRYAHLPRRRHSVLFLYPWSEAACRLPGVSPGVVCPSGFLAAATFALVFAPVASFSQRLT